ncbi:hypothetical protein AB1Y20_021225 [Prymnesium parvum]|uniref:Uncharacterized protein n=1 Tax=Prymnesium parvum TaxID=97485 RepID=A0AB34JLE1_PRYPA
MAPSAAAAALAASYARSPATFERAFQHLTAERLLELEATLGLPPDAASPLLAAALLRRCVHRALLKRTALGDVALAIERHGLREALAQLEARAAGSRAALWRLVVRHPMTSYVPVQCAHCGHPVADEAQGGGSDAEVGLVETAPTDAERPLVRGGWFRGPRGAVVFELHCAACRATSRWFRSSAAVVTLNPHRWGRLCGEQEDARAALAMHLGVPLRVALPMDWDHVWSEYLCDDDKTWDVQEGEGDAPAANFAQRLDEGIGAWTGVLVIGPDARQTCDATEDYLSCQPSGRADASLSGEMPRYSQLVRGARADATGRSTQAQSVNGYLVYTRAGFSAEQVTAVLQRAVEDFSHREWWEL